MPVPLFREVQSILEWLECVPSALEIPQSDRNPIRRDTIERNEHADDDIRYYSQVEPKKRKRQPDHSLLSPPISLPNPRYLSDEMAPLQTPKKRKKNVANNEANDDADSSNEKTPRPQIPSLNSSDAWSLSSASQSQKSQNSKQSSPTRLFPELSINPEGLERIPMDLQDQNLPQDLADLIVDIQSIGMGQGAVPISLKPTIDQRKEGSGINRRFLSQFQDFVYGPDDDLPKALDLDDVLEITEAAVDGDKTSQDETGWNNLVHTPLLKLALGRLSRSLVGFAPCMNANITARYRVPGAPGARVDYAIFVNQEKDGDPRLYHVIEDFQRRIPGSTVNHTPFVPFCKRPISISIESKRQDGAGDKAMLQIGIWQAAQWRLLTELAEAAVEELPFIPGILLEGHEWKLVATTHNGGKTVNTLDQSSLCKYFVAFGKFPGHSGDLPLEEMGD
ncbi:hypothetical protein NCS55_01469600 [Fusarium keratoplasticum]|nr:hypothetical protein NCS55_01469600 [Fusarium keratoplasticum]